MHKEPSLTKGFTLVEVVIATSLVLLFSTLFMGSIALGYQGKYAGTQYQAYSLANEGLEAARNIREDSFSFLTNGTHGVRMTGGAWSFGGNEDETEGFTRKVVISSVSASLKQVESTVTWEERGQGKSVSLISYMGNLELLSTEATKLTVVTTAAVTGGTGRRELQGVAFQNTSGSAVTITNLKLAWGDQGKKVSEVRIAGGVVWPVPPNTPPVLPQSSGTQLDIQDVTIAPGASVSLNRALFDGNMNRETFTLTLTFSDGSIKLISIPTP